MAVGCGARRRKHGVRILAGPQAPPEWKRIDFQEPAGVEKIDDLIRGSCYGFQL